MAQRKFDRLRLAQVVGSLGRGGAESVVVNLSNSLSADRFLVTVVSLSQTMPMAERLSPDLQGRLRTCHRTSAKVSLCGQVRLALALRQQMKEIRPDIVHSHIYALDAPALWLATFGLGAHQVATVHTPGLHYAKGGGWQATLMRLAEIGALRACHAHVIAVSHTVEEVVRHRLHLPKDRVSVIWNGIDTAERFRRCGDRMHVRRALGYDTDERVAICVASFHPQKGHEVLLAAWREVLRVIPHATLLLVGDGPQRGAAERLADDLGIAPRVRFLGARDDVPQLLAAADIAVFASLYEGLPLAGAEAMAMGLPLVATDIPAFRELCGDPPVGVLVPVKDESALASGVVRLLTDGDRSSEIGSKGRMRVEECFSLTEQVRAHEELYLSLANKRGRAGFEGKGRRLP